MKKSILRNKKVQFIIRLITALSFTLFTAYQVYLAVQAESSRVGRLIGIVFYMMIVGASFLGFSDRYGLWIAHSVLLVTGLILLFSMRLFNASAVFEYLDFSKIPSVLNCAVYILSQLGTLVIVAGYLMLRVDLTQSKMQKLAVILMSVAIALYALCFMIECVMIIKYRMNVELSVKLTLLGRLLYFIGFAGTAFCFMLPAPKRERKVKEGKFVYSNDNDDEVDLVI